MKSQQAKKPFLIQYQNLLIFHRTPLFHFIKSLSTIQFHMYLLKIVKPNESCKNSIIFERNALSTTKKKTFKKKRKQSYTSKDKCPNFTNFFRTSKSSNSNLSNGKQRKLSPFMRLLRKEQGKYLQNIYKINYLLKIMLHISS